MENEKIVERLLCFFGSSIAETEKKLGLSNSTLHKFKKGTIGLPRTLLGALYNHGLNPNYFITGEGSPELAAKPAAADTTALIPFLDAQASAGEGKELESGEVARYISIPDAVAHIKGLSALTVRGDSMYPTLADGDVVICDSAGWSGDGVYVIRTAESLFVKRVVLTPGGYQVISDNALYPAYACRTGDAEMIGRVRCAVVRKV